MTTAEKVKEAGSSPGKQAAHPRSMPTTIDKDNYCRESSFGFYFPVFGRLVAIIIFVDIK